MAMETHLLQKEVRIPPFMFEATLTRAIDLYLTVAPQATSTVVPTVTYNVRSLSCVSQRGHGIYSGTF